MMDEIARACWGLVACWPIMYLTQRLRLKALPATVMLTVWTVPVWWIYRIVSEEIMQWMP